MILAIMMVRKKEIGSVHTSKAGKDCLINSARYLQVKNPASRLPIHTKRSTVPKMNPFFQPAHIANKTMRTKTRSTQFINPFHDNVQKTCYDMFPQILTSLYNGEFTSLFYSYYLHPFLQWNYFHPLWPLRFYFLNPLLLLHHPVSLF